MKDFSIGQTVYVLGGKVDTPKQIIDSVMYEKTIEAGEEVTKPVSVKVQSANGRRGLNISIDKICDSLEEYMEKIK